MIPRTIGALATFPTGNEQGGFRFLSTSTGRILDRREATRLPMPSMVIDVVHRMARRQYQKSGDARVSNSDSWLTDTVDDDDEVLADYDSDDDSDWDPNDEAYDTDSDHVDDESAHSNGGPGLDEEDDMQGIQGVGELDEESDDESEEDDKDINEDDGDESQGVGVEVGHGDTGDSRGHESDAGVAQTDSEDGPGHEREEYGTDGDSEGQADRGLDPDAEEEGGQEDLVTAEMDAAYGARSGRYNMRARKAPDYRHLFADFTGILEQPAHGHTLDSVGLVFTTVGPETLGGRTLSTPQVSLKKGLVMFGEDGKKAVHKEMNQIHTMKVVRPVKRGDLTAKQRREALGYLMFLKRKHNGDVKGRGCADGRKQRDYIPHEEATSPTAALESVIFTCIIDAFERRGVAVVDIPRAFLQALNYDQTTIRFEGAMVEELLKIDRRLYEDSVFIERGKKVIYTDMLKALYGTLKAARLFWEKLSGILINDMGFTVNPYDSCVVNRTEKDGSKTTIVWHVDDLKISSTGKEVVDSIIQSLKNEFGQYSDMTISRGKVHEYLGMTLDVTDEGTLTLGMEDYTKTMLQDLPSFMRGKAASPAALHLFHTDEESEKLNKMEAEMFHRATMQLMYLAQRARPDLRTAISFLCTRVSAPDRHDLAKLARTTKYLDCTQDLKLRLSNGDGCRNIRWWIDASFGTHVDRKGHTGCTLSFGQGSAYSASLKQKLVARSSTESELIGVHNILPNVLWTRNFLTAQGINIESNTVFQDNTSTIQLEKNGRMSSSKRTKHIDLRYFHITDRCQSGDISIEYCPTDQMRADYFTKPLQGNLFLVMRDTIMNIPASCKYHSSHMKMKRSVLKSDSVPDTTGMSPDVPMDKLTGPGQTTQLTDNTGYHITQNIEE